MNKDYYENKRQLKKIALSELDKSILKYYKEGKELSGFEGVHDNLCQLNFLDSDLELTFEGIQFIKEFKDWDSVETYNNTMKIDIKPKI